ncbi:MAG: response regulator [Lachnospiraceae bacterium]|nr:response regulator [Lachnospiraceae bacterium]
MNDGNVKTELKKVIYLCMIMSMTMLSILLVLLDILLNWEIWMLPVIIAGAGICWTLFIMNRIPHRTQIYICGIFSAFLVFYYCIKIDTAYGCGTLIVIMIFLFVFTREKQLLWFGIVSSFLGLVFHLIVAYNADGFTGGFDEVVRTAMLFLIIPFSAIVVERIVSAWDITEQDYNERIRILSEENERANNFLANVSHEIRTPISAVLGLSYVLQDEELPEGAADKLKAISEAGHRAAEQISDILDFTEIDMKKVAYAKESYMLSSMMNDLLAELSESDNYGLDLVVDINTDTPAVLIGDQSKIKRVLYQLIRNGYKFSKEGGVCVRIYPVKREYGINLVIEVRDTGIGMSEEELDNVYEKFYQSDSGRARTKGGLGLGIPIVNGFVKTMGGVLTIESKQNEGTTVKISIPQEVEDPRPGISVKDNRNCVVAGFLGFMTTGHPKIREYYMEMIAHLSMGLSIPVYRVQSKEELEKIIAQNDVTHLFVGTGEYLSNREYIDSLSKKMNVALVADRGFSGDVTAGITILPKPFCGIQVASFLDRKFQKEIGDEKEYMMLPGLKALVVDDEHMNLVVAREIFTRYGMIVSTASGGEEAIGMCKEADYDIVFMDHMMPGMDGVEAMHRIKQNAVKANKEICIVALTANAISSAKEMFFAEGFDGFIPKPIEILELERVLKKVLPKTAIVYTKEPFGKKDAKADTASAEKGGASKVNDQDDETDGIFEFSPSGETDEIMEFEPVKDMGEETESGSSGDVLTVIAEHGLDTDNGLKYCGGDESLYIEILEDYSKKKEEKLAELEGYYENSDWKNYAVRVHSIKSTSAMIGASDVSEKAKALEEAAKQKDESYILNNHQALTEAYKKLMELISELI